jgi:glucose-1-phosphate thymidylyltransferase
MLGMWERRAGGERIVPLGIDLCRPAVLDRLRTCAPQGATLSEALVDLAADGRAEAWAVRAPAVRLDSCDAVLEASRLALDAVESDWGRADVADTRIEGRVVIASTAVVRSSVIRGPALIGPGAHVEHAYVGPYTVIGDRSRVECAELENSVLLADVTISSPGWRLEASILGARARVTRGFDLPAAVRLRLGDGALVHTT